MKSMEGSVFKHRYSVRFGKGLLMRTLRLILVLTALVSCSSSLSYADAVLLIGSGDSSNNATIASVLAAQGDTVTIAPTFNNFTGGNLSAYKDVLLVPNGNSFLMGDMPVSGQQALVNYVNAGGGLITSEYLMEKTEAQHDFQTLNAAIPVVASSINTSNSPITFSKLTSDPVMNANLPNSFTFQATSTSGSPTEQYYVPKAGATAFFTTNQWTSSFGLEGTAYGVIGWNYGQGRVISFSTALDSTSLANTNFAQLVDNAVNWAAEGGFNVQMGPDPPIGHTGLNSAPEPAALVAWGAGILGMAAVSYVRRKRASA
jgi:Trehalose utilisation